MYIYKRIRDIREDNDLTQTDIAKMLGLKQQQYARYENGEVEMPIHFLIKLAEFYKVTTDYLLGREEQQYKS